MFFKFYVTYIILIGICCFAFTRQNFEIFDNPISVVYVVDRTSISHNLLSIHSLLWHTRTGGLVNIQVFIIAFAIDKIRAKTLMRSLKRKIGCFAKFKSVFRYMSYSYPAGSSFTLNTLKGSTDKPHWYSSTETVRLFIPQIFPELKRYIYLDNDLIVTDHRVLTRIWNVNLGPNTILGMVTEAASLISVINSYFNKSCDLLATYFKVAWTNSSETGEDCLSSESTHQLLSIMPEIPNNGVMLVDAIKWRDRNVSEGFLALANDTMERIDKQLPHVAMGSQPFIVALLHRNWTKLPDVSSSFSMMVFMCAVYTPIMSFNYEE